MMTMNQQPQVDPRWGTIVTEEFKAGRFEVNEYRLAWLKGKIDKLNRRADKLSLPPVNLNVDRSTPIIRYLDPELGKYGPVRLYYLCSIDGISPRVDGHQLIAKLEGTEAGNLIKTLVEFDLPEEYRTRVTCDQCKTDRYRKNTYILRDQSGELKQVGSNCLADYLRSEDHADWLIALAELRDNCTTSGEGDPDAEDMPRGGWGETKYELIGVLELAASAVRCHGWVSSASKRERSNDMIEVESTSDRVKFHLAKQKDKSGRLIGQLEVTEDDKALAVAALDWIKAETSKAKLSDYLHNCKTLIALETITSGQIGIAVSVAAMYSKAVEKKREIETRHNFGTNNDYIGNEGSRISISARLVKCFNYEVPGHGYRAPDVLMAIYIFRTEDGNTVTWKTQDKGLPVDVDYTVTGTVKAHEDYKGTKQTVLTRCKLDSDALPPVLAYQPSINGYDQRYAVANQLTSGAEKTISRKKFLKLYSDLVAKHGKPKAITNHCDFPDNVCLLGAYRTVFTWS